MDTLNTATDINNTTFSKASKEVSSDYADLNTTMDDDTFVNKLSDFTLSHQERIKIIEEFYDKEPENAIDFISKLKVISMFAPTSSLKQTIATICKSKLPIDIRVECADNLCEMDTPLGIKLLFSLYTEFYVLPAPYRFQMIVKIINKSINGTMKNTMIDELYKLLNDTSLQVVFRYKLITSLNEHLTVKDVVDIVQSSLLSFIHNIDNDIRYRILCCQYVLQELCTINVLKNVDEPKDKDELKTTNTPTLRNECEQFLYTTCTDTTLTQRIRADAADVIIYYGDEELVQKAANVIAELGGSTNIYQNTENVHSDEILKSAKECIEFINTLGLIEPDFKVCKTNVLELAKRHYRPITTETQQKTSIFYKNKIKSECIVNHQVEVYSDELSGEELKIQATLLRISIDKTLFKEINCLLQNIFCKIYAIIEHDFRNKNELQKRLLEELVEMSDTCTTGYIVRLVNVVSGYCDVSIRISWEDQIVANLAGRLNSRIRASENSDVLLEQMINENIQDKRDFLNFFIANISSIKEEMYQEFCLFVSDEEWDIYFKRAMMNYEIV